MDFTAEAMQKTLDIAIPTTFEIEDIHGVKTHFSSKPLHQVIAAAPSLPDCVQVNTLAGFADLVKAPLEAKDFEQGFLIHIRDEDTVMLIAKESDDYGRRLDLIEAKPVTFDKFRFGQWMSQEEFVIAVASKFADTPDKTYVLNMAATLTNEAARTSEDDGFTQKVNVKAGMRHIQEQTVKPRVDLAPFRTFPEIEQPVSAFVFRARCMDRGPELMLVEADGGRWKVDAIKALREAIEAFGLGVLIIA